MVFSTLVLLLSLVFIRKLKSGDKARFAVLMLRKSRINKRVRDIIVLLV